MSLITLIAICIHICIQNKNNILKELLYDYAKKKFTKKQIYLLYIKIASVNEKTEFYKIMKKWILINQTSIIKQLLKA
tara:strand:- start:183 stop:416 length:234 start_codon:yes stop_codon:yes gene_type:complete